MIIKEFLSNSKLITLEKESYLIRLFIWCLFLAILNGYFFNWINDNYVHFEHRSENGLEDFSDLEKFFISVVFAPILETVILQYYPIKILEKLNLKSEFFKIVLPSLLFGLCHFYSLIYVVMTFFSALILNTFYLKSRSRSSWYFVLTALLHAMYNLYGRIFVN
jgi:hypothetical protein